MAISNEKSKEYINKILLSRIRILTKHSFFGLLLMHMKFAIDESADTAYTDGERIAFGPSFLEELSDSEIDFILMHEIMHVVLDHCFRAKKFDRFIYNIAADIVVNANILYENKMNLDSITIKKYGPSMHLAPDKNYGYLYSTEEVYKMLIDKAQNNSQSSFDFDDSKSFDDHSSWDNADGANISEVWKKRISDAAEAVDLRNKTLGRGTIPLLAERILEELRKPQIDWRTILNEFVQEEIVDYSFFPPDRRFSDSDFFLPDFNEKDDLVSNVLFMIDTSGSMSNKMISDAFSEIKGAIDQFNGKLQGWLGFFDAVVVEPKPFSNYDELKIIRPIGGGGTSFDAIFEYVQNEMEIKPSSIIILTDGYAPFPDKAKSMGIPTLWLINNNKIMPPWGKIARISSE